MRALSTPSSRRTPIRRILAATLSVTLLSSGFAGAVSASAAADDTPSQEDVASAEDDADSAARDVAA
uniref:hypothetical protein n=1 Tax=Nocardioides sp. TaxID=35761 RepID=UPI00286D82F2